MAELFRYAAFISYSSKDGRFARRLHRALEGYGIPSSLGAFDLIGGGKKNRIYPIFRDREELSAGALGEQIEASLRASAALIVVCSPDAAASPWVEREIAIFKDLGRRDRIFAIIADAAPLTDENGRDATLQSFPAAFRTSVLTNPDALEPLAADARKGKDGFRAAWLKIAAGLIGVNSGQLIDRDRRRQRARRFQLGVAAGLTAIALAIGAAAMDARIWRTDLTQRADALLREGRPSEAAAFALGGAPALGALLPVRDDAADGVLRQAGAARVMSELGPIAELSTSYDGNWLFFQRADAGGSAAVVDLRSGSSVALGELGPILRHALSADGETLLVHRQDEERSGVLISVKTGEKRELGALGALRNFALSPNGAAAVFFPAQRDAGAWRLDMASGERSELGVLRLFVPSDSGERILFQREDSRGSWATLAMANGRLFELGELGSPRTFAVSANGETLAFQRSDDDHVVAVSLGDGKRTALALGRLRSLQLSANGARLAFRRDDPQQTFGVQDLSEGRTIELGAAAGLDSFALSADGRFLIATRGDALRTSTMRDLNSGAETDLGALRTATLSAISNTLFIERADATAAFMKLGQTPPAELGALGPIGNIYFGAGGARLVIRRRSGDGVIIDLARPVDVSGEGVQLMRAVCDANNHAVRPLAVADRLNASKAVAPDAANDRVGFARVRGRPWNPCDWRGLGAIVPDPARGEGWFEGARQWQRLVQVRHFGGQDWACAEATSRASAETRAARAAMCARFVSDQTQ